MEINSRVSVLPPHKCSSEPSEQSFERSHTQPLGIHCSPLLHKNSLLGQKVFFSGKCFFLILRKKEIVQIKRDVQAKSSFKRWVKWNKALTQWKKFSFAGLVQWKKRVIERLTTMASVLVRSVTTILLLVALPSLWYTSSAAAAELVLVTNVFCGWN